MQMPCLVQDLQLVEVRLAAPQAFRLQVVPVVVQHGERVLAVEWQATNFLLFPEPVLS